MQRSGPARKRVVLVRHARPQIDSRRPAGAWALAEEQDDPVGLLLPGLRDAGIDVIMASPEPKAKGTAAILQRALGLPLHEDPAFREQGNDEVPWFDDPGDFRRAVEHHFGHPDERALGSESSTEASARFADGVVRAFAQGDVPAIVSHGRVMCGYLRTATGVDPMDVWSHLRMPDALVVDFGTGAIARITEEGIVPFMKEEM